MAGDWIKIELTTPSKPEVDVLAELLDVSVNEVIGGLVRLWIWADQQTVDGNAHSVTKNAIDRHSGVTGLAAALLNERVRWLDACDSGGFCFPNFERHNGQTAKQRALTAKRVAHHKKRKGNDASVTQALPREEKRREDISLPTSVGRERARPIRPTREEVGGYAAEIGCIDPDGFWDFYTANGWKVGRNPMKDWRATLRNWKRRQGEFSRSTNGREKTDADYIKELQDKGILGRDDD